MLAIEKELIHFFEQVAQKDKAQLKRLERERCFSLEPERWCFTLPDLHSFLQQQEEVFLCVDYKKFRKLLFNTPVNYATKLHGAEITISDNRGNVDISRYALVWRTRD